MGVLNIRNLPEDVHQALRARAAAAGKSMEAEARTILADVCLPREAVSAQTIKDYMLSLFHGQLPKGQVDDFIAERRRLAADE
jgi:hypothetical protein